MFWLSYKCFSISCFSFLLKSFISSSNSCGSLFVQKPLSWMFDKVLNMLLNWLPKLKMFHFQISLNIKGNKQISLLLGKAKKKESYVLQNSFKKMLLNRPNSYIFARCAVKRQSKHKSRSFTFYLAVPRVLFGHLTPALLFSRVYSEPHQISKMQCFCMSS